MSKINFLGREGAVISQSAHGNYLVVQLSERVTICGTFSNQWHWEESPEKDSGFTSFITYIGVNFNDNLQEIYNLIQEKGGYFKSDESEPRNSKRTRYPLELKVRGLPAEAVIQLIGHLQ